MDVVVDSDNSEEDDILIEDTTPDISPAPRRNLTHRSNVPFHSPSHQSPREMGAASPTSADAELARKLAEEEDRTLAEQLSRGSPYSSDTYKPRRNPTKIIPMCMYSSCAALHCVFVFLIFPVYFFHFLR
jgi:hypothetical protein